MLIAFAGLGRMGTPMSGNLAASGHTVLGYDPVAGQPPAGVTMVADPTGLARAQASISMLPDAATTRDLVCNGLASAGPTTASSASLPQRRH